MSHLKLENIHKNFGNFAASKDISFEAKPGSFITLLGPSGCGKTTLLKIIAGFHTADKGQIFINNQNITHLPPEKRDTAMCFQSYALFPHLSVRKNIAFGLEQQRMKAQNKNMRIQEAMMQVDMTSEALKLPSELSGGQQQRVALARAMAPRPSIILFDEPLSNLDAKLREKVRFKIRNLQKELGFTAIYVTHDQSEALAMSDKIIILNAGSIEQMGSPKEVYNAPKNRFVADFIGAANICKAKVIAKEKENFYQLQTEMGALKVYAEKEPQAEHIYICWRPEDAQMDIANKSENIIHAHVQKTAFLGNHVDVFAESNNIDFRLEVSQRHHIQDNQPISFALDAKHIHLLEEVS